MCLYFLFNTYAIRAIYVRIRTQMTVRMLFVYVRMCVRICSYVFVYSYYTDVIQTYTNNIRAHTVVYVYDFGLLYKFSIYVQYTYVFSRHIQTIYERIRTQMTVRMLLVYVRMCVCICSYRFV
jgi:hypothetical protein